MTCNIAAVRSVPGRSQDDSHCRRCHSEIETLPHVLGSCPFGEALRNVRHHTVRKLLADSLRKTGYIAHEEVSGIAVGGSTRRIDIIAFKPGFQSGYILDPTMQFEMSSTQPKDVDNEKKAIYEPTVPYYKEKYKLEAIEVIGLFVGARGIIPKYFVDILKGLRIINPKALLQEIVTTVIKGSVGLLSHHLYDM